MVCQFTIKVKKGKHAFTVSSRKNFLSNLPFPSYHNCRLLEAANERCPNA